MFPPCSESTSANKPAWKCLRHGKALPSSNKRKYSRPSHNGLSVRQISANARVSADFVQKVLKEYNVNNYSVPRKFLSGRNAILMNDQIRSYLETEKLIQPSMRAFELQQRLLLDGVCFLGEIPVKATVNDFLHKDLKMTEKKNPTDTSGDNNRTKC